MTANVRVTLHVVWQPYQMVRLDSKYGRTNMPHYSCISLISWVPSPTYPQKSAILRRGPQAGMRLGQTRLSHFCRLRSEFQHLKCTVYCLCENSTSWESGLENSSLLRGQAIKYKSHIFFFFYNIWVSCVFRQESRTSEQ